MGKKGKSKSTAGDDGQDQSLLATAQERKREDIPEDCACCGTIFRACAKLGMCSCAGFVLLVIIAVSMGAVDMGFGDSDELREWREAKLTKLYRKEKNSTYLRTSTLEVEVLSENPKVWLVPGFLSARECEFVREVYGPWLHTCNAVRMRR